MRAWRKTYLASERGASAVEFALVASTLLTFLVGITQFGITFFHYLEIIHAAREGARWAALSTPDGSVATPGTTKFHVHEAAPGLKPALADDEITVDPPNPTSATEGGNPVTVTVEYDTPIFTPMMRQVFGVNGPTLRLTSSAVEKVE